MTSIEKQRTYTMSELNIQQLKEFFEFRATIQDKAIDDMNTKIDDIGNKVITMADKVNTLWKAGLAGIGLLILAVLKSFGLY